MTAYIVSNGVTTSTTLNSGDTLSVLEGGSAISTLVHNGGVETVYSGGVASFTTVSPGGTEAVSGGVTHDTTVHGGFQTVYSGGIASGTTLSDGGEEFIDSSASGIATTVDSGSVAYILSGGVASAVVINAFGTEQIGLAGSVAGGTTFSTTVNTSGTEYIQSGGVASETTLNSRGVEVIYSGGSAISTTVSAGGVQYVFSGGVASRTTVESGGQVSVGLYHGNPGGTTIGTMVNSGGQEDVLSGGVASSTTLSDGGVEYVFSGGATVGTVIDSGGEQDLGVVGFVAGGTATGTVVSNGGREVVLSGGVTSGTIVHSGGLEIVSSDGTAIDTVLMSGGAIDVTFLSYATGGSAGLGLNDLLTVSVGGQTYTQHLSGDYTSAYFHLVSGIVGGTAITTDGTPCYCRGTLILTDHGEIPVEDLPIGDHLVTHAGRTRPIKWIGRRGYSGRFAAGNRDVLPVLIERGALGANVPRRDLCVSPLHAMFVDDVLVPAFALVNGVSIVQAGSVEQVEYFHLELDSHDIIIAEGAPSETFIDDDSRGMFHNAAEYRLLYPDAPRLPALYCAPRVEDGEALEAIRRRIIARTQPRQSVQAKPGALRGFLDRVSHDRIEGWARDDDQPTTPVALQVLDNGVPIARVVANRYRADLVAAGLGDGRHGFELRIPGGLSPLSRHVIEVRREADGSAIGDAPVVIEPVTSFDPALQQAVATAIASLGAPDEQERVLSFLAAQAERLLQRHADGEGRRDERLAHQQFRRRFGPAVNGPDPGKRALVIDDTMPDADRDAGSQAILSHMRALQHLGYAVSFAAGIEMMETDHHALQACGITCCRAPFYASVEEVLRRQAGCFDVVYLHRASNAGKYLALARQYCPKARILYSVADLHHIRLERQAEVEDRPELLIQSQQMRVIECTAAWSADAVITHSSVEAALLRQAVPSARVHVVPWEVPVRPVTVPFAARNGVAFIGGFAHSPNVDAAQFLALEIMPLVWRHDPRIECLLVGSQMPDSVRWLGGRGIRAIGAVANLGEIFDQVRLTVAPLRYGAGVKGKVLASLAAGAPCVMSAVAAEGIAGLPGDCVGADAAEIAALICRMHESADANQMASAAGLSLIQTAFTDERVTAGLQAAIDLLPAIHRGTRIERRQKLGLAD